MGERSIWDEWHEDKASQRIEKENARMDYAGKAIANLGYPCTWDHKMKCLLFQYKGATIRFYPFTGWHTGKTIKDGRGLNNLLKQLQ
jgi:hypothetical protein